MDIAVFEVLLADIIIKIYPVEDVHNSPQNVTIVNSVGKAFAAVAQLKTHLTKIFMILKIHNILTVKISTKMFMKAHIIITVSKWSKSNLHHQQRLYLG